MVLPSSPEGTYLTARSSHHFLHSEGDRGREPEVVLGPPQTLRGGKNQQNNSY